MYVEGKKLHSLLFDGHCNVTKFGTFSIKDNNIIVQKVKGLVSSIVPLILNRLHNIMYLFRWNHK